MSAENFTPEKPKSERILEGAERKKYIQDLQEYVSGLEAALADPDLPEDEKADMEEQLEGLRNSLEDVRSGGEVIIKD